MEASHDANRFLIPRRLLVPMALAVAVGVACGATDDAPITIAVSPPRIEVEIGSAPVTAAMRVFNMGSTETEIQATVHAWHLDADNRVTLDEPDEQSLDQWMVVSPLRFTIPPGGSQTVRFSVRPRVQPEPGEHRAIVYFEQSPTGDGPVKIVGRMGVAIYAYAGAIHRQGELHGITVRTEDSGPVARFDISSDGSAHVRLDGRYRVWTATAWSSQATAARSFPTEAATPEPLPDGVIAQGSLPTLPVLPGYRRQVTLPLAGNLPHGDYVLDVLGKLEGQRVDAGIPFRVGPLGATRAAAD